MMLALLKKDFMLNRVTAAGNFIAMLGIYAVAVVVTLADRQPVTWRRCFQTIGGASIVVIFLTCALITVYAGCIFAQERREKSANFLAMMPVRRRPIIVSKLIAAWCPALGFVLANMLVLMTAAVLLANKQPSFEYWREVSEFVETVVVVGAITGMGFGIAWMLSTFLESPTISAGISFGVTVGLNAMITIIVSNSDLSTHTRDRLIWILCTSASSLIGITTFLIGTRHYLKRVEP